MKVSDWVGPQYYPAKYTDEGGAISVKAERLVSEDGSASTRERLNALVPAGYGFVQKDYTQHVITPGNKPVPGSSIEIPA